MLTFQSNIKVRDLKYVHREFVTNSRKMERFFFFVCKTQLIFPKACNSHNVQQPITMQSWFCSAFLLLQWNASDHQSFALIEGQRFFNEIFHQCSFTEKPNRSEVWMHDQNRKLYTELNRADSVRTISQSQPVGVDRKHSWVASEVAAIILVHENEISPLVCDR